MTRKFHDKAVNGLCIRVWEGSSDKSLIMLHGIGSNKSSFNTLADAMPENWNLIAWDAPGYGGSVNLSEPFPDAGNYAKKLYLLLSELNLPMPILLGHSLGTLIAARFARDYPQTISGLILLASAQGHDQPKGQLSVAAKSRLNELDRLGSNEFAKSRAERLMYQPKKQPEVQLAIVEAMAKIRRQGYAQAVHMLAQGNLKTDASQLRFPSLVIVGDKDIITPPIQSQIAHQALSASSNELPHIFHQVTDAGHAVHQQYPKKVVAGIIEFENQCNACLEKVCP